MDLRLHADSADLPAIRDLLDDRLITGVTTNPTILARAGLGAADVPELAQTWHDQGADEVFFQAVGRTVEELMRSAEEIAALGAVVKVPATRAGFAVTRRLADLGVPTLLTAVYSVSQAVMAAAVGATYIAPYLGRLNDAGLDGLGLIAAMHRALDGAQTRVLVASVRTPADVENLVGVGITDLTAAPAVWQQCMVNPASEAAAAQFLRDAGFGEPLS